MTQVRGEFVPYRDVIDETYFIGDGRVVAAVPHRRNDEDGIVFVVVE